MREVSIKQFSSTIDEDVPRSITMSFSTFSFGSARRHPANRSRASTVVASSDSFRMMRYSIRDRSVRGTSPATICVKQEKKHDSTERLLELRRRKGRQEPQRTHVETQHRRHRLRKQRRREEKRPRRHPAWWRSRPAYWFHSAPTWEEGRESYGRRPCDHRVVVELIIDLRLHHYRDVALAQPVNHSTQNLGGCQIPSFLDHQSTTWSSTGIPAQMDEVESLRWRKRVRVLRVCSWCTYPPRKKNMTQRNS